MPNVQNKSLPRTKSAAYGLPPPGTKRRTRRPKPSVIDAVFSGVMSLEEAHRRSGLSVEEFRSWNNAMKRYGMRGLYTTKLQNYRYFLTVRDFRRGEFAAICKVGGRAGRDGRTST